MTSHRTLSVSVSKRAMLSVRIVVDAPAFDLLARLPPQNQPKRVFRRSERRHQGDRDTIRLVTFMPCDLGFFDHETGRIECADNPFETSVLPE